MTHSTPADQLLATFQQIGNYAKIAQLECELRFFGATNEQIAEYRAEAQISPLSPTEYLEGKLRQWKRGGR